MVYLKLILTLSKKPYQYRFICNFHTQALYKVNFCFLYCHNNDFIYIYIYRNSIGSFTTAAGEVAAPLNSNIEARQLKTAVDPVPELEAAQKRLAAELEENDFPPSKRSLSTVAVEDNLDTTYKVRS